MAIINGIQLLHKRYADWSGKTLQAGELGLNLTTLEVRIGTATNQSWENASVVSCKVEVKGEGVHVVDASYADGKLTITKGTISYNDLANKPDLNFDPAGTGQSAAATAVNAHNSSQEAHSDIRGLITALDGELDAEVARAKKAEGDLQTAVDAKVAQSAYDTKVGELVAEDERLGQAINTEKGRVDGIIANYETKATAEGKYLQINTAATTYETITEANKVRDRVEVLEQAALSGLSRQIVTELPSVDSASENVIYMILRTDPEDVTVKEGDIYDEYLLMGEGESKRFELLGNTAVDFTDYYTKDEVYTKEETATAISDAVTPVSQAVAKEVTDRENAVEGVQNQLDALKGENGYKKEIADAVKVEKDRAELAEQGLDERIDAIEELGLIAGSNYATQADLNVVKKSITDEAVRATNKENEIAGNVSGLTTRMGTAEGDIDDLEAAVAVINGEATQTGSIKEEAKLRADADTALGNRISDLEKITADGALEMVDKTIRHKTSGVVASTEFGFYALKVDAYGHITGVEAISTLDGNDE